jgi:hypothetical protein
MSESTRWTEATALHRAAAARFASIIDSFDDTAWSAPIAAGKWSPALIAEHLNRAYEVMLDELGGGQGMQLRTRAWQRVLLRFTIVPRLLRGGWFPAGARAPRETRPPESVGTRDEVMGRFHSLAQRFDAEMSAARNRDPRVRLTHAYFGKAGLADSMLLCARHLEHHVRQVEAVGD